MVKIIGFAGPAGVGKDTTCDALLAIFQSFGEKAEKMSFADPLYDLIQFITGIPKELLRHQDFKNITWTELNAPLPCLIGWTPRKFLQKIGTEGFRDNIHQDFWIQKTIQKAKNSKADYILISDARFVNEFKAVDMLIELNRYGIDYARDHASAMNPPQELVNKKYILHENFDYKKLRSDIIDFCK
jgi:hypothetical protein